MSFNECLVAEFCDKAFSCQHELDLHAVLMGNANEFKGNLILHIIKGGKDMAKLNVIGNAAVITSTIKYEDIKTVKKYRPDALVLYDGEGEKKKPVFAIDVGAPQANQICIIFNGKTHDDDGFATYTELIPSSAGNIKEELADIFGATLTGLKKIEATFPAIIEEIKTDREAVLGLINLE